MPNILEVYQLDCSCKALEDKTETHSPSVYSTWPSHLFFSNYTRRAMYVSM